MTAPLEDYAMIGDCESAALVSRSGSIDWLCWPRFDSDACFAALLGDADNGQWLVCPKDDNAHATHRYRGDSLILETEFASQAGAVRLTDFMPIRVGPPALVRIVSGLRGSCELNSILRLRFGYGMVPPWIEVQDRRVIAKVGPDMAVLDSDLPFARDGHDVRAEFGIREGERHWFVLQFAHAEERPPGLLDYQQAFDKTEAFWREWIGRFERPTHWPEAVRRSLVMVKALTSRRTGGIVAAPTTSLPEVPAGKQNWDYRYCWLRDSAFAIHALLNAGYHAEAVAWRDWILRAIAGTPEHIRVMYRVDGDRHLYEWNAEWLPGFGFASPVRIGNAAALQKQIDVYGELIDALHLVERAGLERTVHGIAVEQAIVEAVERQWREAGHGIWESRGKPRRYVYSQVMAWVAIERALKSSHATGDQCLLPRMKALREEIRAEVCREGFDSGLGTFVQFYGGRAVDASLLLIPLVGFLPADDARMLATIRHIERELVHDGLVYRSKKAIEKGHGAFLACSCWLADCRQLLGQREAARDAFERLLSVRNDVGLLSEEYDLHAHRLTGNFPQTLSHLALVTTALGLSGPILQRGGG